MANIVRFYVTTVFSPLVFQEGVQKAMQWLHGNVTFLDYTYTFEVIANKKEWTVRLFP